MTTLSVILPTYNGAAFIVQALRSVFAQTRLPEEIVVVDDHSGDDTLARVEEVARTAPVPVHIVRQPTNSGGPAAPINAGVRLATGDFLAVLDQDDVYLPGHLEQLAGLLEGDSPAVFAFALCGDFRRPDAPGAAWQPNGMVHRLQAASRIFRTGLILDGAELARLLLIHGNFIVGYPGFVFRRADWLRKGGADETLRLGSDYDLVLWLSLQGPVAFLPKRLYLRRTHGANLTTSGVTSAVEMARLVRRYLDSVTAGGATLAFWQGLAQHYLRILANLGWIRYNAEVARRLWEATRAWGYNRETPWAAGRLLCTWAWCHLGRNTASLRAGEREELLTHLDALRAQCQEHLGTR